ncbi:orotate phosphoribosyltransferase [Bacillus subtilis]|nr:orotate phosphoribosyltransferase [Bacillus subtilis]
MKQIIAKHLLDIQAVFLRPNEPFTWASGILSPIYCDNRLTLSFPEVRNDVASGISKLVKEHFPEAEMIAGTATAGIPHAALAADHLNLPMCYVRSKPKAHGKGNQIEGAVQEGQKTVVIEDLISTGGSVLEACAALQAAGCEVLGVVSIFTYGLPKAEEAFAKAELHTTH